MSQLRRLIGGWSPGPAHWPSHWVGKCRFPSPCWLSATLRCPTWTYCNGRRRGATPPPKHPAGSDRRQSWSGSCRWDRYSHPEVCEKARSRQLWLLDWQNWPFSECHRGPIDRWCDLSCHFQRANSAAWRTPLRVLWSCLRTAHWQSSCLDFAPQMTLVWEWTSFPSIWTPLSLGSSAGATDYSPWSASHFLVSEVQSIIEEIWIHKMRHTYVSWITVSLCNFELFVHLFKSLESFRGL